MVDLKRMRRFICSLALLLGLLWASLPLSGLEPVQASVPYSGQGFVLVTERASTTVAKIDVATDQIIGRATAGNVPSDIVVDPVRRWAYVSNNLGDSVSVVRADSLTAYTMNIPDLGRQPIGVDLTSDYGTLLVATRGTDGMISNDDRLDIIQLNNSSWPPSGTVAHSVFTGLHPITVRVSHDDHYAVVTVRNQPAILVIDLQSYTIVAQAPGLPVDAEPEGLDRHPTANVMYATLHGPASAVQVIDLDTLTFPRRVPIVSTPAARPSLGAFTPDGNRFYISGQTINKVLLFETADPLNPTQNMGVVLPVGPQPHSIVYLPGDRAYVANTNNGQPTGSISIISNYSGNPSVSGPILTNLAGPIQFAYLPDPCEPVASVAVHGPGALRVDEVGIYSATYAPLTATLPVTLTWDNGSMGPSAAYSWNQPGSYTVGVSATNPCGGSVGGSLSVSVCQPVEGAQVNGPLQLYPGETGLFTATFTPLTASLPVTFVWNNGALGPTASYSWTQPGNYPVVVTASNDCGTAGAALSVEVIPGCQPVEEAAVQGPASLSVGQIGLYSATWTPLSATLPVTLTWDNGAVGPTAAYSWTLPGNYTVTVSARNECGEAGGVLPVTVTSGCRPIEAAAVTGPLSLLVGQTGLYSASYLPLTATQPVTMSWNNGAGGTTAVYSWTMPGSYTVTVTATNECGQAAGHLAVEVTEECVPVGSVVVSGPGALLPGEEGLYSAAYEPITASQPITLSWGNGALGPTATYSWTVPGSYTVTVTATGPCGEPVAGSAVVQVQMGAFRIYLPVLLKSTGD